MRKKILLITIMIIMSTLFMICNISEAISIDNIEDNQGLVGDGTESGLIGFIKEVGQDIYSVIFTLGIVSSVIVLSIIGLKYMMGSVEEKAEYKKSLMPYVIGCALVFGASTLANILYNFIIA